MEPTLQNDTSEMFFILWKLCGYLSRPSLVEALQGALDQPGGDRTRLRLLEVHQTLTAVLADRANTSH